MIQIGLTGSIAMGKSEVSRILTAAGIPVFDSDHEVHELYNSKAGAELLRGIVPDAIDSNTVNRAKLSALIVQKPELLSQLEPLVHAEIAERRASFVLAQAQAGQSVIVHDIPLLFEKSLETTVDVTLVISSPADLQKARALARPGMTEQKLKTILARQMPDAEKRKRADYVIENNGGLDQLRQRTLAVLTEIKKEHSL